MRLVYKDPTFSFELLRTLSYAPYGGADVGECLMTAHRIPEKDLDSWFREWNSTAERILALGQEALAQGQVVGAREAFFRASNYFRTAEFFLHGNQNDPRLLKTWQQSRSSFRLALPLLTTPAEIVKIPYENTSLHGYFYQCDSSGVPRPTLVVHGGYDSTGEELYWEVAAAALQRGYNCLTFEGPGQGALIREERIPFRGDWENVVSPVIDYLETRKEVDCSRIGLMGISLGGYLAPRAAAHELRLAALIANDGLFSFRFRDKANGVFPKLASRFGKGIAELVLKLMMHRNVGIRWAIENGLFTYQVTDYWELMQATDDWSLKGHAERIRCPTLVCAAEGDHFFVGQPEALYDALTCDKTLLRFTADQGAEEHCQFGALTLYNHRAFEWLDRVLQKPAPSQ